ncbi:hypothetical protein TNCV_553941 [Trichonephila clavipes]|nr:hypothetical protein TNCV_553941 [Trichonephila clavipes]
MSRQPTPKITPERYYRHQSKSFPSDRRMLRSEASGMATTSDQLSLQYSVDFSSFWDLGAEDLQTSLALVDRNLFSLSGGPLQTPNGYTSTAVTHHESLSSVL